MKRNLKYLKRYTIVQRGGAKDFTKTAKILKKKKVDLEFLIYGILKLLIILFLT